MAAKKEGRARASGPAPSPNDTHRPPLGSPAPILCQSLANGREERRQVAEEVEVGDVTACNRHLFPACPTCRRGLKSMCARVCGGSEWRWSGDRMHGKRVQPSSQASCRLGLGRLVARGASGGGEWHPYHQVVNHLPEPAHWGDDAFAAHTRHQLLELCYRQLACHHLCRASMTKRMDCD
jgi:hypothetical protein